MTEKAEPPARTQCIRISNEATADICWAHALLLIETRRGPG